MFLIRDGIAICREGGLQECNCIPPVFRRPFHLSRSSFKARRISTDLTVEKRDIKRKKLAKMAHGSSSHKVAWPSGPRRWIKAQVSSGVWVRIPPLPRQHFRRHSWLQCLSEETGEVTLLAPGLFQTLPHLLSLAELGGLQRLTMKVRTQRFLYL